MCGHTVNLLRAKRKKMLDIDGLGRKTKLNRLLADFILLPCNCPTEKPARWWRHCAKCNNHYHTGLDTDLTCPCLAL